MPDFSQADLESAKKALSSSIRKIEKARETLLKKNPLPKPQLTLAERNLKALRLSIALIEQELKRFE